MKPLFLFGSVSLAVLGGFPFGFSHSLQRGSWRDSSRFVSVLRIAAHEKFHQSLRMIGIECSAPALFLISDTLHFVGLEL